MDTKSILVASAAAFLVAGIAPRVGAQSMSTLQHAKRVASNAAAATNEHIEKEQMVGAESGDAGSASTASTAHAGNAAPPATARPASPASRSGGDAAAAHTPDADGAPARSAAKPGDTPEKGQTEEITLMRESFTYSAGGRRDPFISLIANGDLRPMISDLRLVTVIYAGQGGGRSVAVMRDVSTKEQYRVRAGQTLGRMRVSSISPKSVTFTIEEYGFSRQEVLALNDTTRARSQ